MDSLKNNESSCSQPYFNILWTLGHKILLYFFETSFKAGAEMDEVRLFFFDIGTTVGTYIACEYLLLLVPTSAKNTEGMCDCREKHTQNNSSRWI